jgi:hypothetical protein
MRAACLCASVAKEHISTKRNYAIPLRKARRPLLLTRLVLWRTMAGIAIVASKFVIKSMKKSHANVSSIKFDSCYLLTKGANGVKAKFVGTSLLGTWAQRRRPFGYQRA